MRFCGHLRLLISKNKFDDLIPSLGGWKPRTTVMATVRKNLNKTLTHPHKKWISNKKHTWCS